MKLAVRYTLILALEQELGGRKKSNIRGKNEGIEIVEIAFTCRHGSLCGDVFLPPKHFGSYSNRHNQQYEN
jgi:hypothetical protein